MLKTSKNNFNNPLISLLPLYLVIFIGFVGYSLMITLFTPMFLQTNADFIAHNPFITRPTIALGFLLCLYPLGQFIGSPILGAWSDYFGRKPVLLGSLIFTSGFYLLIITALLLKNLLLLAAGSFLAGLTEANIAIAQSAIADTSVPEQRAKLFGYIYLSASSAYIIGPLLGGKLADPALINWFNYATPFWVVLALLIITTLWILFKFKETKKAIAQEKPNHFAAFINLAKIITDRHLTKFYLTNFLLYLAIFGFFRCYPMYLVDEFQLNVSRISEFIAWVGFPIILTNLFLTGWLAKRFSTQAITITSSLCTGLFMLLVILFSSINMLWPTLFLTSLALAVCLPACATLLSIAARPEEQGTVMGNNQALQVAAESISGLMGGLLAAIAVKLSLFVLSLIAIITAIMLIGLNYKMPRHVVDDR